MNQKAYSVLFCALLASTFVHELRAKGVAPVSSRRHLGVFDRSSSQTCALECTGSASGSGSVNFNITVQAVGNVLIVLNTTGNAAFLLDISSSIVVVLNGTVGSGVAFNLNTKTGVSISSGLWVGASGSITVWLASLSSGLSGLFNISGAVSFTLSSVSTTILAIVNNIIVKLILGTEIQIHQDAKIGLQLVISIATQLVSTLSGSLSGALALIVAEGVAISVALDLLAVLNIFLGFQFIVVAVWGTLSAGITAGFNLKISALLGAANGLIALANIILALPTAALTLLAAYLASPLVIFKVLYYLSGAKNIGISGVLGIAYNIALAVNGSVDAYVVVSVILQVVFYSSTYISVDLSDEFSQALSGLIAALAYVNATSIFASLVTVINGLINAELILGVNIAKIISLILVNAIKGTTVVLLEIVIQILVLIGTVIAIKLLVYALVLNIVFLINSALGVAIIVSLGISLSISASLLVSASILVAIILSPLLLVVALVNALLGNFFGALLNLHSYINVALSAVSTACTKYGIDLKAAVNAQSTDSKNYIIGYLQGLFGLSGTASVISTGTAVYNKTCSSSALIGFSASASITIGVSSG